MNLFQLLLSLVLGVLGAVLIIGATTPTRCATSCTQASDENVLGSGLDRWMSI
ncbi:MAG: hypothetical protein ACJ797_14400 [Ktedonobacteraceae bacterium]